MNGLLLDTVFVSNSKVTLEDICIVGNNTNYGIYSDSLRIGVPISNNHIRNCENPVHLNYFNGGEIINNTEKDNSARFIYIQSEGDNTIIDGNFSEDALPILSIQPYTSPLLSIGENTSSSSRTSYKGYVTMLASQNFVYTNNGMFPPISPPTALDPYYRVITLVSPEGDLGSVWVDNFADGSEARIYCSAAPSSDTKIYYTATAIPYSATQ